jgi:photosynthesis system II assembly factor YCF48-like protein
MAAREEDKAMAGLLRRSLAQDAGAAAESGKDCPGPEILAAYFDHALDAQETARYDLHFSRCSLCREQLAAMARAGDAPDANDAEKKHAGAWDWFIGPRWVMPAAAALAALLVITGIAWRMKKPAVPGTEVAMSRPDMVPPNSVQPANSPPPVDTVSPSTAVAAPETAPPAKVAPSAPSENPMKRPAAPAPRDSASAAIELGEPQASRMYGATSAAGAKAGVSHANAAPRREALTSGGAAGANRAVTQAAPQPQPQTMSRMKSPVMDRGAMRGGSGGGVSAETTDSADTTANVTDGVQAMDTTAVAQPAPPAKPPAKKAEAASVESAASVAVQTDEAKELSAPKTKLPVTAAAPSHAVGAMNLSASKMSEAAALAKLQEAQISSNLMNLQIQTPDPKILWMIVSAGAIEKSEDGGATWKPEYLERRAPIVAGSAPTVKICWLVGGNGIILRTTNGTHWKTISAPAETSFMNVEATDASTATVTALDGRRFSTVDGGKSWSAVK